MRLRFASLSVISLSCLLGTVLTHADGLNDLKTALARLQGQAPVKAVLEAKTWRQQGEGKEQEEQTGIASVWLEESSQGLRLQFNRDTLSKLETEARAKEKDPKAKTPTIAAMDALNATGLREMTTAAANLARDLDKAKFKSERTEAWNGKPARVLSFELDMDKWIKEKDRKYVKKFSGNLDIWIAADGTPMASRQQFSASGRALLVISFDLSNSEDQAYGVVGDRLITLRKDSQNKGSGAGEKSEERTTRTLQLQS